MNISFSTKLSNVLESTQKKTFLLLFLSVLMSLVLFTLTVRPTILKIARIKNEITVNTKYLMDMNEKIEILRILSGKLDEHKQSLNLVTSKMVESNIEEELLENLADIASKSGFDMMVFESTATNSITEEYARLSYKSFLVEIKALSGQSDFGKFIHNLEQYSRPIRITGISKTGNDVYNLNVRFYSFVNLNNQNESNFKDI